MNPTILALLISVSFATQQESDDSKIPVFTDLDPTRTYATEVGDLNTISSKPVTQYKHIIIYTDDGQTHKIWNPQPKQ